MKALELVRKALAARPMTIHQLVQETGLARRTIYGAVRELRNQEDLHEQVSLRDARQTWMWLPGASTGR